MWNDFHLFGEMFMDLKNFANSLGHNFTGNKFEESKYWTIYSFVHGDINSWVRVTHEIQEALIPNKNNNFTVCY